MRYSKQEKFIGKEAQNKLKNSVVAIIGIGALGTNVLDILTRSGIGKIKIIDRDIVELSNLSRQTLFTEEDIGKPKVYAAKEKINKINSEIIIEECLEDLDYDNIELLKGDLILDCTDNIYTRFLINEYSRKNNIPWIYSSVIGAKGMIMNITEKTPCFSCVAKEPNESLDTCDSFGIIGSAPKVISGMQATEAIKILTNNEYCNSLIRIDLWKNEVDFIKVNKKENCKVCNGIYEYLSGKKAANIVKICGSSNYQIKLDKNMELIFKNKNEEFINLENITIFKSGRALVKADSLEEAKKIVDNVLG